MGLWLHPEGADEPSIMYSYNRHGLFMMELARTFYGDEMGDAYKKMEYSPESNHRPYPIELIEFWNARCNDDIDVLLFHSDWRGDMSPEQCAAVSRCISHLKIDMQLGGKNILSEWIKLLDYCAYTHTNLLFE